MQNSCLHQITQPRLKSQMARPYKIFFCHAQRMGFFLRVQHTLFSIRDLPFKKILIDQTSSNRWFTILFLSKNCIVFILTQACDTRRTTIEMPEWRPICGAKLET